MIIVQLDSTQIFLQMLGFGSFVIGWMGRGLAVAIASDLIYRPLAKKLEAKMTEWEQTHPVNLQFFIHFLEHHKGIIPIRCKEGTCQVVFARSLEEST